MTSIRRNALWAVIVVAAALIQTTWLDAIRLQNVLPDLTLLLVVYFAAYEGEERAMFTGVLGGLYQDVAGNVILGHHILCHVVVGYIAGRMAQRLITDHPAVKAGIVLCAGTVHGVLYTFIQYVQTPEMSAFHTVLSTVLPTAFYTAIVTPIVFFIMARSFRHEGEAVPGGAS
jgi:rod shape-determining protein MreD